MSDDPETTDDQEDAAGAPTPEEFKRDPARNPDDDTLEGRKRG